MPEQTYIVDTNVVVVADGGHSEASLECMAACSRKLNDIVNSGRVAIDDGYEILREYLRNCKPKGAKGPGSAFVKWVLQNQRTMGKCDAIRLMRNSKGEYEQFPMGADLANFDPADKKFVALCRAHPLHPPILEAADSKWLDWRAPLAARGVVVDILCRADMERFRGLKRKS